MSEIRAKLAIADGFKTLITAGNHTFIADEPPDAGGKGDGPTPYELMLSALGACTAMTLKMYIEHKKLPITDVEVIVSFERIHYDDCESCVDRGYEANEKVQYISRLIYVTGEVTDEQKKRLEYIAGRCPVHITLHSNPRIEDAVIVKEPATS